LIMHSQKNLQFDNIIFSLQKNGGGSTYWFEILKRAYSDGFNFKDLNYSNSLSNSHFKSYFNLREQDDDLIVFQKKRFFERFRKPSKLFNKENYVFHSSYYRVIPDKFCKNIITIHDFIPELYYGYLKRNYNYNLKKNALNNSEAIICVSHSTKNDLLNFFPNISENKISVIHNGAADDFVHNNNPRKNFILFVGSRFGYKMFEWAIKAVAGLAIFDLVIVGSPLSDLEIAILTNFKTLNYRVFSSISNMQLNELYNTAFALIYPSEYEGFGLPVLEAMKAGCPVIARRTSSIPEIVPKNYLLLESYCLDEFSDKIEKLKLNYFYYQNLGLIKSSEFSWNKSYSLHKELYNLFF
jgi:mannosyltransferase